MKEVLEVLMDVKTDVSKIKEDQTEIKKDLEYHVKRTNVLEGKVIRDDYRLDKYSYKTTNLTWFIGVLLGLFTAAIGWTLWQNSLVIGMLD